MKKLIYCAAALATALFAGSCQQELLDTPAGETTFTYSVEIPEAMTKAIGDGTNVNNLFYEVWITKTENDQTLDGAVRLYHKNIEMVRESGKTSRANVTLNLVQNQFYTILFWAQCGNAGQGVYDVTNLTEVTYKENVEYKSNKEMYAAFYAVDYASDKTPRSKKVLLKRPFAQINLGTTNDVPADEYTVAMTASSVTVKNVPTTFNVATSAVSDVVDEFTFALSEDLPKEHLVAGGKSYDYAAMNYIFAGGNIELDYTINTMLTPTAQGSKPTPATITRTIPNVPVKENYRTNIVGSLLTNHSTYEVIVDASWNDFEGGNMVQLGDGIVVNLNGDYEISNENGLAYAMNNLFKENGTYYLTKDLYDMAGFEVTPPSVPSGVVINIYGETPVVTRSTTGFAGITIKGLTQPLIGTVSGEVSVSGVTVKAEKPEEVSVLIKEIAENATVVVSKVVADKIAETGENHILYADDVKDLASLKAALESDIKVIDITADFDANEAIVIDRSITINGKGNTLTSSYNRVINFTAPEINVEINDWSFISTAARNGNNGPRGLNIWGPEVHDAILTFNNCSVDFTHPSANDWTYAINCGVNENNTITINGGTYEGANVVNVWGKNHTITIDGAVLTSLYQPSSAYYGFCVSLQEAENSIATIKNSTLNSVHAMAFGGTTKNEFVLENNTDNTQVYPFYIENNPYLTLNDAFAAAENNATIYAPFNAEIASSTVPEGKKVTLVLQNQATEYKTQLTGVDNSTGSFGLINVNPGADLTITGPGSIKLSATENRGWNAYSSVVSNQRGTLTVNGGAVIEHLGGTDMAYGIDNLTNGKGTSAITTINKATVKSPYRAIRQFLNGVEATNELYVNAEAVIEGANKSIWMQDPSANANTGKLVVEEGAKLYGDVYLYVCAGSESWPVSASIPASTLMDGSEVMTGNLPEGYSVEEKNGVYEVTYKSPAQARLEALINEGGEVVLTENIELSSPIEIKKTVTLDLNGKTITAGKDGYAIENKGELTIKNNGVINGVVYAEGPSAKTTINGGTYNALENAKFVLLNSAGASLEINAATINGGSSYPIYSYDANSKLVINDATVNATFGCINAYGTNGTVEINGGTFQMTGVQGKTSHIAYFSNVDAVINGGTFEKVGDINMSGTGGGGICAIYGAALKITNGTFAGDNADLYDWGGKNANNRGVAISVKGGTYKFKPTFLAEGFAATQNADGTWTVAKN